MLIDKLTNLYIIHLKCMPLPVISVLSYNYYKNKNMDEWQRTAFITCCYWNTCPILLPYLGTTKCIKYIANYKKKCFMNLLL